MLFDTEVVKQEQLIGSSSFLDEAKLQINGQATILAKSEKNNSNAFCN